MSDRPPLVTLESLGVPADALDGPVVLRDGSLGLLVSLRGAKGGVLLSPSELGWARDLPAAKGRAVAVFVRTAGGVLALGAATIARRGSPKKDGYKLVFALAEPLPEALWRSLVDAGNAPLPPAPEEAIAALAEDASAAARVQAMLSFLERWFGFANDDTALALPAGVPEPLAALHRRLGSRTIHAQNALVPAGALREEEGRIPFYVENQGVFTWACERGADPAVVRRAAGERRWVEEKATLSGFLAGVVLNEAIFGAPFGASVSGAESAMARTLARKLPALPLPGWKASGVRFHGGGGVIASVGENGDGYDLWVGAREAERLAPLESLILDGWDDVRV